MIVPSQLLAKENRKKKKKRKKAEFGLHTNTAMTGTDVIFFSYCFKT